MRIRIILSIFLFFAVVQLGCDGEKPSPEPTEGPSAGTVDTVVGTFTDTQAQSLKYPVRVAVDAQGTTYFSDNRADQIVGYKDGGQVVQLANIPKPLGLAVAGSKLYVGSNGRGSVEVYSLDERRYLYSLGAGAGEFKMPNDIAVSPDGERVYVADSQAHVIKSYDAKGAALATIGEMGNGESQLRFPAAVATDGTVLVVADQANHRLQVFDAAGKWLRSVGEEISGEALSADDYVGRFTRVQGLAVADGKIYALDSYQGYVQVFDLEGKALGFVGARGECDTCVKLPLGVAKLAGGGVVLTDPERGRWVEIPDELRDKP